MAILSHWLITQSQPSGTTPPPPPPPPPVGINAPNPAETVWRLGIGGVPVSPTVAAGFDLILTTTLYNNGVALSYSPDPILEAVVWRGDQEPNGFFPQIGWISAPASTIQLTIPAVSTVNLEPGHYRMRVGLTVQGTRLLAYDGGLDILEAPGSDVDRVPYVSNRDLVFYYDQLKQLQNYVSDETGFMAQRVDASNKHDRKIINQYNPRPGFVKARQATYDPILGYDVPDPTVVAPTKALLTSYLLAGGLIVEPVAREIISRMAIAIILDRQETEDQNPYRDHAKTMWDKVNELWMTYQAQIDSNSNGVPEWLIDRDATFLPSGAAP